MNLIEQIKSVFQTRKEKKAADFTDLVAIVAQGGPVDPEQVAALLDDCAKTPEELQAAVEHKKRRLEMAAIRDTLPGLRAERAEVEKAWDAEAARWGRLVEAHNKITAPLTARALDLDQRIREASGMADRLRNSYRGPLTERLEEIGKRRQVLYVQTSDLESRRNQHQQSIRPAEDTSATDNQEYVTPAEIESHKATVANYQSQIDPLQAQIAALDRESDAIEAAMCEP